jgi:hypothetical protein
VPNSFSYIVKEKRDMVVVGPATDISQTSSSSKGIFLIINNKYSNNLVSTIVKQFKINARTGRNSVWLQRKKFKIFRGSSGRRMQTYIKSNTYTISSIRPIILLKGSVRPY